MIPHYGDEAMIGCGPDIACSEKSDSTGSAQNRRAVSQSDILVTARSALGTPFRHQGRTPQHGFDCVGLILWVAWELDLSRYDQSGYPRSFRDDRLLKGAVAAGFTPVDWPETGDMICLSLEGGGVSHAGITTGKGIIHACERVGKVIEHRMDAAWRRSIHCGFRFPGIE
ncbi:hypothetical protein JCM17846_27180 [Iodidimonas nitroreducens]|uniref:NlpC/P60 domain-containing protein n=1 Tax=Iodidimonas nitroreducens TaxID=1236968 RepID=A0A5A7NDN3_9PROT|nr:NlpC/P60 family protein [Iodidimonas nitroreducens]GER05036.1 hypothetical protein JCM17846_27180 [Iodidimonas nitroreducens]